jgi:UDP-N-acetylmuramoyl-tripeptide--D-alanyl-D-alanine ligase
MQLKLSEIRMALGLEAREGRGELTATGYSIDSRTIEAGELFFAVKGERFDGHSFVAGAMERGAVGAVVARARVTEVIEKNPGVAAERLIVVEDTLAALQRLARWVRERWRGRVVGVTGSAGKTTTKEAVAQVLARKWRVLKSHGNLNNAFGMPLQLLKVSSDHDVAVLEMGMSSAGEIAALARIAEPDWGVVTVVAPVHTEFFADGIAGVARAKRELIEALPASGVAFLNADDARVAEFREHSRAKVVTFGAGPEADVQATEIEDLGLEGMAFVIVAGRERRACRLALLGRHNVSNAVAAAAVGLEAGVELSECVAALEAMRPPDARGQVLRLGGVVLVNDCYNSNPRALDAMVDTLRGMKAQRRIVVAGEMLELGPESDALHAACGRHMAEAGVDVVVGVRGQAKALVDAAAQAGVKAQFVATAEEAGEWLIKYLRRGDAVLLKASRGVKLERALERYVEHQKNALL